jgi:hypothetical protein
MFTYNPLFAITLGSDPELFISRETGRVRKRKAILGSELVIPEKGLAVDSPQFGHCADIVRDGVQIELHPIATSCRANMSNYMQAAFQTLDRQVKEVAKKIEQDINIDFSPVVKPSKGDLLKLSPESRQLGCNPSFNIYGRKHIEKDGLRYLVRSAAGHIHFGSEIFKGPKAVDPKDFVRIMDVLVGNTCVLMDRDPNASLRRKAYGRAGEYRLPKYGVEYRTLSNFWLHNYRLMSFVMGMTKIAGWLTMWSRDYRNGRQPSPVEFLMAKVDLAAIERAINTNDWDLAFANYNEWVRPFFAELHSYNVGVQQGSLEFFDFFLKKIREAELAGNEQPLRVWFKEDPLTHWKTKPEGHGNGWESFLHGEVSQALRMENMAATKMQAVVEIPKAPEPVAPTITIYDGPIMVDRIQAVTNTTFIVTDNNTYTIN